MVTVEKIKSISLISVVDNNLHSNRKKNVCKSILDYLNNLYKYNEKNIHKF